MDCQSPRIDAACDLAFAAVELLHLSCIFCHSVLSFQDICSISFKTLRVIVRGDQYFGSCSKCLRATARYERRFYTCSCKASKIAALCRQPLTCIIIRCEDCMKLLSFTEKLFLVEKDLFCHLIRGHWRSQCRLCLPPEIKCEVMSQL